MEECRVLDLGAFAQKRAFLPGFTGNVEWSRGKDKVASIGFVVVPRADHL